MHLEAELAQLLIRMGGERGVDAETILAELSSSRFPSFVDADLLRESVLDEVESWWRLDLEKRISQLRSQFTAKSETQVSATTTGYADGPGEEPAAHTTTFVEPEVTASAETAQEPDTVPDATIQDADSESAAQQDAEATLPSDATMIWTTRG